MFEQQLKPGRNQVVQQDEAHPGNLHQNENDKKRVKVSESGPQLD